MIFSRESCHLHFSTMQDMFAIENEMQVWIMSFNNKLLQYIRLFWGVHFCKTRGKFRDKVSTFKLPCCQGQLALFRRVTFWALVS